MISKASAVIRAWSHYECASLAAGVAFYGALSLFPLIIVLIAGVGFFLRFVPEGADAEVEILHFVSSQLSPELSGGLGILTREVKDQALVSGPVAVLILLFTASLVFAQVDRAFGRIWDVRRFTKNQGFFQGIKRHLATRARSVVMIISICVLISLLFVLSLLLRAVSELRTENWDFLPDIPANFSFVVGSLVNVAILTLLYRYLSKEAVTWRSCFSAGIVAALLWEGGSQLLAAFSFGSTFSVYGLLGTFLIVMLWIYYNVLVLLVGALIVRIEKRASKRRA